MTIKIAHLYYDLLNLYGENGNIRALEKFFKDQNVKVEIHFLTKDDKISFKKYDIYYMGMGTEENQKIVIEDILKYKKDIKEAVEDNKYFFITGNSYEIFGKYIIDFNNEKIDTLNIFDYYTKVINVKDISDQKNFRIVGEASGYVPFIKEKIIGFQNRAGFIYDNDKPLFKIKFGTGNNPEKNTEGYTYKNFYATYFTGPIFIRNPYLTYYFVKKIIKEKDKNFKFKKLNKNSTEVKAYNNYLENFPNM